MKTKFLFLSACCLLLPLTIFSQEISITVDGQKAQRRSSNFSMLAACGQQQVLVEVTADPQATVKINGTIQTTATVSLPAYGDNTINITVTPQGGSTQNYTLTVNKPIPFHQIAEVRWDDTLSANNNPANNGGYTFTSFKWFRNGILVGTKQNWTTNPNGDPINPADVFYLELTATGVSGIICTCAATISLQ